jgi:hypothetical protein
MFFKFQQIYVIKKVKNEKVFLTGIDNYLKKCYNYNQFLVYAKWSPYGDIG